MNSCNLSFGLIENRINIFLNRKKIPALNMLTALRKPYPFINQNVFWVKLNLLIGLSVFAILFFILSFQNPAEINLQLFKNTFLFGFVTSFCMGFCTLLLPNLFKYYFSEQRWTLGKNILLWSSLIVAITIANVWLASRLYTLDISIKVFYRFFYYTIGISFIVMAFVSSINYKLLLKVNTEVAGAMNVEINSHSYDETEVATEQPVIALPRQDTSRVFTVVSENEKEAISFSMNELLYIESADNYSKFLFLKNAEQKVTIIRTSLKRIEQQDVHPYLFRCHRSYLVNLSKIILVSGNAQGYQLKLLGIENTIPVARNSGKELLEKLRQLK